MFTTERNANSFLKCPHCSTRVLRLEGLCPGCNAALGSSRMLIREMGRRALLGAVVGATLAFFMFHPLGQAISFAVLAIMGAVSNSSP